MQQAIVWQQAANLAAAGEANAAELDASSRPVAIIVFFIANYP